MQESGEFSFQGARDQDHEGVGPGARQVYDIDKALKNVYHDDLMNSPGLERSDHWYERWKAAVRFSPQRYDLPGGSVGRRFVEILAKEVSSVANLKENSERMIVFQAVVLQKETLHKKSGDVRRLLTKRMDLLEKGEFDVLMSEAKRCNE